MDTLETKAYEAARKARWYEANREAILARQKIYRAGRRKIINLKALLYYEHIEERQAYQRDYQARHARRSEVNAQTTR